MSATSREHPLRDPIYETIGVYDAYARVYLRKSRRERPRISPLLQDLLGFLPKNPLILDLGCGPGRDVQALQQRGISAVGLELSLVLLRYARRRHRRASLVRADLRHPPFRCSSFDGIWAAASLIHLPKRDVKRAFRLMQTLLRPGGLLAATIVHGKQSGFLRRGWLPGRYFSRWHKGELERAVSSAGWEIVALRTVANRERKGRWLNLIVKVPLREEG